MLYVCYVPALVKSFLSWYPWVPLSRLSYGLYLTHPLLISRGVFITRNPQHNDYFEIVSIFPEINYHSYCALRFKTNIIDHYKTTIGRNRSLLGQGSLLPPFSLHRLQVSITVPKFLKIG